MDRGSRAAIAALTVASALALAAPAAGDVGTGSTVFFERIGADGTTNLWWMDGGGANQALFFPDGADISVAPDRQSFAFDRASVTEPPDVYVAELDGSNVRRLTTNPGFDFWPDWSPDGARITFTSDQNGQPDIYVMAADGSDLIQLTSEAAQGSEYSPDGRAILFVTLAAGLPQIAVMNADGTGRRVLTDGPDFEATWSPDGSQIAFVSARDGTRELYLMNADGSGQTRLTTDGNRDLGPPSFSPAGDVIAFMSRRGGNYDVWTLSLRTGEQQRLTTDAAVDGFPEWLPGRFPPG